jgi:type IV pilus assembly protein PilC
MAALKKFRWQGINQNGYKTNGEIVSVDVSTVKYSLLQKGITPIKVTRAFNFISKRINALTLHEFTHELAILIKAGIPLITALQILIHSTPIPSFKLLLEELQQHIQNGKQFSEALQLQSYYFNDIYCYLIQAGEQSGKLDTMLQRLTTYQQKALLLKQQIKKALFYPTIVLILAIIISMIMMVFIIPRFSALFTSFNAQLPPFTRLVIQLAQLIQHYAISISIFILFIILMYHYAIKRFKKCRYWQDYILLQLPLVKKIIKITILARSFRTLATLLMAGLPLLEALEITGNSAHNHIYYAHFKNTQRIINNGQSFHTAFIDSHLFPARVTKIIALGEESGNLDNMLSQLADYYENKVDEVVARFTQWLEPVIMLILCVIVGGFIIAMYLPIFRLSTII